MRFLVSEWVQKFMEGDISIVKDVVERHDKINNSESLMAITSVLKTEDNSHKKELAELHEKLAFDQSETKRKEIEYTQVIEKKDNDIKLLIRILQDNNIKLDNVINNLDTTNKTLNKVKNTLDKAINSVVEKRNTKDDRNYLCILRLNEQSIMSGIKYDYYVIRCTCKKTLDSRKNNLNFSKTICTIASNYAVNSWKVIKDKLKKERKIATHGNHFYVYENKGISVISERELEDIFKDVLNCNRNRVGLK